MKRFFLVFLTLLSIQFTQAQFNFRQHKVVAGDDVYSIAKEYGTTPKAIYNLNPTAKSGIQPDTYLVIPNVIIPPELPVEGIEFKKCKVKKKQTLYGIAKKHGVSVDDIKKYNSFVTTEGLKKGDILRIPFIAPKTKIIVRNLNNNTSNTTATDSQSETQIYTVKSKETRYGIARKFGITISELENMNPNLGEDFPIGVQILVPKETKIDTGELSSQLKLYRVPPKQTMYSLSKEFGISIDSIIKLNPEIADGLKADMVIQVPNTENSINLLALEKVDLSKKIVNYDIQKVAILLPFEVQNLTPFDDESFKNHLKKNRVTRIAVDFFSGATLAIEKAKSLGINAEIIVADTQKNKEVVNNLVTTKNLETVNAVIGPLYNKNVEKLASLLESAEVPVFSPISTKTGKTFNNLYQTLPNTETLENKILDYIKLDTLPKNIVVIADQKHLKSKKKIINTFPEVKVLEPIEDNFIKEEDLLKIIGEEESELPNWVFLESSNLLLASNVVSLLSARAKTHKITLFTTDKSNVYDNEAVSNRSLSKLNFHYPSANKVNTKTATEFLTIYANKYGSEPNKYAVRGYDLTLDVLLRLGASYRLSELNSNTIETEYLENKFKYINYDKGGMINTSSYIMKYSEDLLFEVIE